MPNFTTDCSCGTMPCEPTSVSRSTDQRVPLPKLDSMLPEPSITNSTVGVTRLARTEAEAQTFGSSVAPLPPTAAPLDPPIGPPPLSLGPTNAPLPPALGFESKGLLESNEPRAWVEPPA